MLSEEAGRARVYTLNRDHLAAEPIAELASLRQLLFDRLRKQINDWQPMPVHVSVFGSAARGDGDLDSDVDIFLVRPRDLDEDDGVWRGQVEALAERVFEWTGNHAGIAEVSEGELERLRRDEPGIVTSLRADAIDIAGSPIRSMLRRL